MRKGRDAQTGWLEGQRRRRVHGDRPASQARDDLDLRRRSVQPAAARALVLGVRSWPRSSRQRITQQTSKTLKMGLVCEPMSRSIQRNGRTPFGLNSHIGEGTCHAKAHAHPVHDARRCRAVARGPDEDPSGGFTKGAVSSNISAPSTSSWSAPGSSRGRTVSPTCTTGSSAERTGPPPSPSRRMEMLGSQQESVSDELE